MSIRHSNGDPGAYGGGTVLDVEVGDTFNVEIWVDTQSAAHAGYQWEIAYHPWYFLHTGNDTGLDVPCSPASSVYAFGYTLYGQGAGCISAPHFFVGIVQTVELQCIALTSQPTPILLVAKHSGEDQVVDQGSGTSMIEGGSLCTQGVTTKAPARSAE